ncbi:MAG: rhodanese-related sulfurtransferase [Verrucomicrobiales bacterium]|jgi:rhodanese-related sulfurtransferase
MNAPTIDPKSLSESLSGNSAGAQIVDVRTPTEFEAAHIAGSKLAPLDSLDAEQIKGVFDTDRPIYVVCRSGNRAKQAIEKLHCGLREHRSLRRRNHRLGTTQSPT